MATDSPAEHEYVFRNWAGNVVAKPRRYLQPQTENEVLEIVKRTRREGGRVRVVGAGHSWTDAAACDDTMINLDHLDRVIDVDFDEWQITVQAGIRLKDLIEELDQRGMAMLNVGSVAEQSIAGAIGTGTHGSGLAYGSLSTQLVSFRMVCGDGVIRTVTPEDGLFYAGAVSFGSLGIMTQVTLQVEPTYDLQENCFAMPFEALVRLAPQLYRDHPRLKFWWLPHTGIAQVFTYDKTHADRTPVSALADRFDAFVNQHVFSAIIGVGRRFPRLVPQLNNLVGASYFKPYTRVDRWDRVLTVAMPPVHLENEYGLDVELTVEMMERVKRLIERRELTVGFVNEIRFVKADDNWLSAAYGRDSVQFGAYTPDGAHARAYLEGVEDIAYDLGARPHWGKNFHADPAHFAEVYPMFDHFARLREEMDPANIFVNDFVARIFAP